MAVYVDPLRDYFYLMGRGRPGLWCHLVTDGAPEELHAFAARLGVPGRAFQDHPRHPHYDLPPYLRERAVMHGAVEVSTREMLRIINSKV